MCILAVHMHGGELQSLVRNTKVAAVTKMSVFAFVRSCVASVLQHGPPASSENAFRGGIRGFQWMNKTDMSNPVQYTAYLRAYVAQRRKISSDMPAEKRDGGMSGYEEGGSEGSGREEKQHAGQDLQECGQLRQSLGRFESPENS